MTAKKRFSVSMAAAVVALLMVVASVAIVFSALTANVRSGFTISYTAHNVKADVAGAVNKSGTEENMKIARQEGRISYNGTETSGGGNSTLWVELN